MIVPGADHEADLANDDKRQPIDYDGQPLVALRNATFPCVESCIERFGTLDLFTGWLGADRLIPDDLALNIQYRRDISVDPVVVTVIASILDDPHPRLSILERGPHVSENRRRDVRMANQVVRRADQIATFKTADFRKDIVAVGDGAGEIGG